MDEWQVGDPIGLGNDAGVPDIPYMGYLNGDDDEDDMSHGTSQPRMTRDEELAQEAYDLQSRGRFEDALRIIGCALRIDSSKFNHWNIKAIILDNWGRYEEALEYYDRSLELKNDRVVRQNKAFCLYRISRMRKVTCDWQEALDYINQALAILPDDEGRDEFLRTKGFILSSMGKNVQSKKCYLLADGMMDEIRELERKEKQIKDSRSPLINITGTKYYKGTAPLGHGVVVDLVKEPENVHDRDAIRVEIDGETLGYVANAQNTVPDGVKSASQITGEFEKRARAEVMFSYPYNCIIAKLL